MINKLTIENQWMINPNKIYFIIQNPEIDEKKKKLIGLEQKVVEYTVKNFYFTTPFIQFERCDKKNNKRFPEILEFNKQYPDASNAVPHFKKGEKKLTKHVSYAIFNDEKEAKFQKLVRLHRLAEKIQGMFLAYKTEKPDDLENQELLKQYFDEIQNTNYFEELEQIQSEFPDLSVM